MALVGFEYCNVCQKETQHINRKCVFCENRELRQKIAAWQALTVEEKLTDINNRLEKLERPPATY